MSTRTTNVQVQVKEVEKQWFTIADAARYLGTSKDFIRSLTRDAKVSFSKVGGLIFLPKREIDKLIERCRII